LSYLDVERLYNLLCFKELANQGVEEAKFAPARSWSPLKKALNVWFSERFGMDRKNYYAVIVNQFMNPESKLKKAIHKALVELRQTYNIEIQEKEEKENREVEIPPREISVTGEIDWWYKQEDSGKDYFAVEYFDSQEQKQRLFYLDFIVKKDNKLYLLDTKKGETAKSQNTKDKAEALQKWIKANQEKYTV